MDAIIVHGNLGMTRGSVLRVEDGRALLVYVWEGLLRVTREGGLEERLVRAGEWLTIARKGATLLQALKRSALTLSAPRPQRCARRIALHAARGNAPRVIYEAQDRRPRWPQWWQALFAPLASPGSG